MFSQSESFIFQKSPLDDRWAKKAEELSRLFPSYLVKNPKTTIGCSGGLDQDLIYLEFQENGKLVEWKIDSDKNDFLPEIEGFMIAINQLLAETLG